MCADAMLQYKHKLAQARYKKNTNSSCLYHLNNPQYLLDSFHLRAYSVNPPPTKIKQD
jgi:hypothetical protein